jgi:hypothetical protein
VNGAQAFDAVAAAISSIVTEARAGLAREVAG